ncbi:MAG: site-specific integrase [Deltaproteobacteria bacterium]|nr:site-specific integrase [Deltaproteobacteria bacterium]
MGDTKIEQIAPEDVLFFLNSFTNGNKPYTKRFSYSHPSAFFNFFRNNIDPGMGNPCDTPMIRNRIFPISYEAAWMMVLKAGKLVGINLRPHDLRRHSATFASRSGVLIEIISKVILRHGNLATTQRYLGTISDTEAIRWIENLYG